MPHGRHIYQTGYDVDMAKICAYPPSQHTLPHWKCVLRCCVNFPSIYLPVPESDWHHSNTYPSISFHVYSLISRCIVHVRHPLHEKKNFHLCFQYPATMTPEKLYTRKEIVMMEKSIADFHTSLYIPAIQSLSFHLPHVHILGTNQCGNPHF